MKKVAIVGSCCSRELFNDLSVKKHFTVSFYAFQINMWNIVTKGVDFPKKEI